MTRRSHHSKVGTPLSPKIHRRTALVVLLLTASGALASQVAAQEQDSRILAVEEGLWRAIQVQGQRPEAYSIQERMDHYNVPGVSIAVLDSGEIAWARAYGVRNGDSSTPESGRPVYVPTLFQAASISKPVAAVAVLRLVERGELELDRPVNDYLVSWKIPANRFTRDTPVTLRHLLSHTGGLTVHGFPGYALDVALPTTLQVLEGSGPANTDPIEVDTIPSSVWRYSGGGYTVVQQLLEDVTGTSFPQLMRELVLDPAGMTLSTYDQPLSPGRTSEAAHSHLSDGTGGDGPWHVYPEMAAAGLWTNPSELAKLALDLQASYQGEEGHLLSPATTRTMLTPVMGGYGLGFAVAGTGPEARFSHGGSNYGFKAQFMAFKEAGRGVFVMTNGDQGSSLAQEVILAVAREYAWPVPGYREVILAEVSPGILREIAGTYRIEEQDVEIRVEAMDGHLQVKVAGTETFQLHPTAANVFIDLEDGTRIRIDRNESGEIQALQVLGGGPRAVRIGG